MQIIDKFGGISALENIKPSISEAKYSEFRHLRNPCWDESMKSTHGTVFAVPLPDGTFLSGRVLLDIRDCLRRRMFSAGSPLPGLGRAHLIEMYSAVRESTEYVPSEILIRGAFVESDEVGIRWPVVGQRPVDPRAVEFPESVVVSMHRDGAIVFQSGEIRVPLPFPYEYADRIGEFMCCHSAFLWPFTCLRALGRETEVPRDYQMASLKGADLRYSKFRAMVYEHLPFSMEAPYFDKQQGWA